MHRFHAVKLTEKRKKKTEENCDARGRVPLEGAASALSAALTAFFSYRAPLFSCRIFIRFIYICILPLSVF